MSIKYNQLYDMLYKNNMNKITDDIVQFIESYVYYCETVLGEGYFGKTYVQNFGPFMAVQVSDKRVVLPVIIKENKHDDGIFDIIKKDGKTFIYSMKDLSCEAILLLLVSKLWYDSITPHTPFMLAMERCTHNKNFQISKLITERHGLYNPIIYDNTLVHGLKMTHDVAKIESYMATLKDLLKWCDVKYDQNLNVELPNGITVYYPDFVDQLVIAYLHTDYIIWNKLKILITDQHAANIFIHWISESSHIGAKQIDKLQWIYYQIDKDRYIKLSVPGCLLKIGDIGTSICTPQRGVYVFGDINEINRLDTYQHDSKLYSYDAMLLNLRIGLTTEIFNKTRISKILNKKPFSHITINGLKSYIPDPLTTLQMDEFKDLCVSGKDIKDDETTFIVKLVA